MSARLVVSVVGEVVDRVDADLAVVGCLEDERPLRGAAARADWRLCGALSALLAEGARSGSEGEAALLPSRGGVRAPRVLALGLGAMGRRSSERLRGVSSEALRRALRLRARRPALALLSPDQGEVGDQVEELVVGLAEGSLVAELEGEHCADSVIIGDNAYEVVEGFLGEPIGNGASDAATGAGDGKHDPITALFLEGA